MNNFTTVTEWQNLVDHHAKMATERMQDWFDQDPERFKRFSLQSGDIFLDYSKNRIKSETIELLCQLAFKAQLPDKINDLFNGNIVNPSEKRPALHTALRSQQTTPIWVQGQDVLPPIQKTLEKMRTFTEKVRDQTWRGATGQPVRDIINIGIGGSHLGPRMATHALAAFSNKALRCHYISNIDTSHIQAVLQQIDPERSLFIISSKSFTTLETITNANTVRKWLHNRLGTAALDAHFVAVTAAKQHALQFGIAPENIFPLWDWVGGRYSIWSAIGLPLALMIGMDLFLEFLAGANQMDEHFRTQPFSQNMPVILGLLGIWYINFFKTAHHAIVPYSHDLNYFRTHLQQLEMESNGKNIATSGQLIDLLTAPVILGEQGCNGQHAFHQLLHQGQHLIPVDFILVGREQDALQHHQDILVSSGLSQAEALMRGKRYTEALEELHQEGFPIDECERLAKHKVVPGNRPSTILFLNKITPRNLGALLALYEHKTFVQGTIWQINSFDQWGVELGKQLLPRILSELNNEGPSGNRTHDSSTEGLISHYKNLRRLR